MNVLRLTSPAPPARPLTRGKAWACAAVNQLAFPGLGTIMAGRRGVGLAQAAVMVAGFVFGTGFLVWFFVCTVERLSVLENPAAQPAHEFQPYLWIGLLGGALCVVAWCWSLLSSVDILRQAMRPAASPTSGPPALPVT